MELVLERAHGTVGFTGGRLFIDGRFECFTLEDQERPVKIKGETAIPLGRYQVTISFSPRFKKLLPLLHDVPNFEGIRIHPGNTAQDTEGCILLGLQGDDLDKGFIGKSQAAFHQLFPKIQSALDLGQQVWMTIK